MMLRTHQVRQLKRSGEGYELPARECFQPFQSSLVAMAAFLDTAEWGLGRRHSQAVDTHQPAIEPIGYIHRTRVRIGEGIGSKTEGQRVGSFQNIIKLPKGRDGGDRAERFLSHHSGAVRRSEEHTSELQSLMRTSYAVC